MRRIAALIVLGCAWQSSALAAEIPELIADFDAASNRAERIRVVSELTAEIRAGSLEAPQVNRITRRVLYSDAVPSTAATSLLKSMLENSGGQVEAARAIGNRLAADGIEPDLARSLFALLAEQHTSHALPDAVYERISDSFPKTDDPTLRTRMYEFVRGSDWALTHQDAFLPNVARLLESKFPDEERWQALELLSRAAADSQLPSRAASTVSQYASRDPDPRMRVAAWSIDRTLARANGERGINLAWVRELTDPHPEHSLFGADEVTRERGIAIILEAARPHLSRDLVDGLIAIAAETGSLVALQELADVRRRDGLLDVQLQTLRAANPADPAARSVLTAILAPPLTDGSLLGPIEAVRYSRSRDVRREAFLHLLETYATAPLPDEIAELAYEQMTSNRDVPAYAGILFARARKPHPEIERELLALVDRSPRPHGAIVAGLSTLNDDADNEYLVREYAGRAQITETFRASLVGDLYQETRAGKALQPQTVSVLQTLGESAENYGTVDRVIDVFDSIGEPVSWSIRVKSMNFQWTVLGYVWIASWVIAFCGGVAWLLHLALPSEARQSAVGARVIGLIGWLLVAVAYAGANVTAFFHSLGHTSTPPPNQAAPYYAIVFAVSVAIAAIGIGVWIRRSVSQRSSLAE